MPLYFPQQSYYTGPVTESDQIFEAHDVTPPPKCFELLDTIHQISFKTCNDIQLARKCAESALQANPNLLGRIVDDSKSQEFRNGNIETAKDLGLEYICSGGENSLARDFIQYVESNCFSPDIIEYIQMLFVDYPNPVISNNYGGVAGVQNLSHLATIMSTASQGLQMNQLLATFIDDDVTVDNSDKIRQLQSHYIAGRISGNTASVVAGNYLGHSGNPASLYRRAITELNNLVDDGDISLDQIKEHLDDIFKRQPKIGLRKEGDSDEDFTTAELTLKFPGGNYTLIGEGVITNVPVSIGGAEDVIFNHGIVAWCLNNGITIARGPDFAHNRQSRTTGESAYGDMISFLNNSKKDDDQYSFEEAMWQSTLENLPDSEKNLQILAKRKNLAMQSQIQTIRKAVIAGNSLHNKIAGCEQMKDYGKRLKEVNSAMARFGKNKLLQRSEYRKTGEVDQEAFKYGKRFFDLALQCHPTVSKLAWEYGKIGKYADYQGRLKK